MFQFTVCTSWFARPWVSRRLELSISKTSRTEGGDKLGGQCQPKVPGRSAFPGARNPRIHSISRFGKKIFQQLSRSFPREPPNSLLELNFSAPQTQIVGKLQDLIILIPGRTISARFSSRMVASNRPQVASWMARARDNYRRVSTAFSIFRAQKAINVHNCKRSRTSYREYP